MALQASVELKTQDVLTDTNMITEEIYTSVNP